MRRFSRGLLLLQANSKGSQNRIRSSSNIAIHTPTSRPFTKSHFILQQEGNSDSLIQTSTKPTPTSDKNIIGLSTVEIAKPPSWNKDSLLGEVIKFEYMISNKSRFIQVDIEYLNKNFVITLNHWNQLYSEHKGKYPAFLVTVLDKACQQVFGRRMTYELNEVMAFQNNTNNIKKVGEAFLHNLSIVNRKREQRYLYLVIASGLWGVGKTRFAFEFLGQWRKVISSDVQYNKRLEERYSEELKVLDRATMVYVTLAGAHRFSLSMEQSFNHALMNSICAVFNVKKPSDQEIEATSFSVSDWIQTKLSGVPIFLAIDELGIFVQDLPPPQMGHVNPSLYNAYRVWERLIHPLQCTPNLCVYIAGKGAYLDYVGKGRVRYAMSSPTQILSVQHHLFIKSDLEGVIEETPEMSKLHEHLKGKANLKEYVINKILDETGGVPLLVKYVLFDGRTLLGQCNNEKDVDQYVAELLRQIPGQIKYCYSTLSPALLPIYEKMMVLSLLDLSINIEESIRVERLGIQNSIEFAGSSIVDIRDMVSMLNCYVQPVAENRVKLVFPRIIRESFKHSSIYHSEMVPVFESIVNQYGHSVDKGDFFEHLVSVMIRLRINDGANTSRTLGQALPFLKGTPLDNILCVQISETLYRTGYKLTIIKLTITCSCCAG